MADQLKCDDHGSDFTMVCRTCSGMSICTRCVGTTHKGHYVNAMKQSHKVVPTNVCQAHKRLFIFACKTCKNELICWNCFHPRHMGHKCVAYDEHMSSQRKELERWHRYNHLQLKQSERGSTRKDLMVDRIQKRRDELKDAVNNIADKLVIEYETKLKEYLMRRNDIQFRGEKVKESQIEKLLGKLQVV